MNKRGLQNEQSEIVLSIIIHEKQYTEQCAYLKGNNSTVKSTGLKPEMTACHDTFPSN